MKIRVEARLAVERFAALDTVDHFPHVALDLAFVFLPAPEADCGEGSKLATERRGEWRRWLTGRAGVGPAEASARAEED